jgi:hypothetical protein
MATKKRSSMSEVTKGQQSRKAIQQSMIASLPKYCPIGIDKLADFIAYEFHMSPYTIRYTYLPMFITVGILEEVGNGYVRVSEKGNEAISRGELTDVELREELEEENEQRSKLGKSIVTLEEWKQMRTKRIKPI